MHLLSGNYRGTRRAVPATQNYRRPEVGGHLSAEGGSAYGGKHSSYRSLKVAAGVPAGRLPA